MPNPSPLRRERGQTAGSDDKMSATITLEFPEAANDQKVFKVVAKKVILDFRRAYKGYAVNYTSLPKGYLENDTMEMDLSNDKEDSKETLASGTPEAKLVISGLVDAKKMEAEGTKHPQGNDGGLPPPAQP